MTDYIDSSLRYNATSLSDTIREYEANLVKGLNGNKAALKRAKTNLHNMGHLLALSLEQITVVAESTTKKKGEK